MDVIRVGGRRFPQPSEYRVEHEDIGEFRRNANGGMVGDIVAKKARISCAWDILEDDLFKVILGSVKHSRVDVEFYDPEIGGMRAAQMMTRPGAARIGMKRGNEIWWRGVGVSFIEW